VNPNVLLAPPNAKQSPLETHALDNHHIIVSRVWNLIPSPTSPVASNLVTLNSEVLGSWSFDLEILDFNNNKAQWHSDYEALM
jgi:hypothetical protein